MARYLSIIPSKVDKIRHIVRRKCYIREIYMFAFFIKGQIEKSMPITNEIHTLR